MGEADEGKVDRRAHLVAAKIIANRRAVRECLPPSLTHDPVPDILLSLYVAERDKRYLSLDDLVNQTGFRLPGLSRWIAALNGQRLIIETGYLVGLSEEGRACVNNIISKMAE